MKTVNFLKAGFSASALLLVLTGVVYAENKPLG
jgi:hypothetical protein